jgi:hypothetical protein
MTPSPSHLNVVTPAFQESPSNRAKRLLAEAKAAALEHVAALENAMEAVSGLSADIADGGDAYPVGVRELARQLSDDTISRLQTLNAILNRTA